MQQWPKIHDAMQNVDIVLFDQFSNHCLANFIEPLRAANGFLRRTAYQWRFFTLNGAPVSSSSGMQIAPHDALARSKGTALMLMPSYGIRKLDSDGTTGAVRSAARRYAVLGGLDTGSWLLARAGFLGGYRATIHWDMLDAFAETFPDVECLRQRYVIDADRVTCSGAMAAFDLANSLVASAHGPLVAMEVAQLFMLRETVPALPVRAPRSHGGPGGCPDAGPYRNSTFYSRDRPWRRMYAKDVGTSHAIGDGGNAGSRVSTFAPQCRSAARAGYRPDCGRDCRPLRVRQRKCHDTAFKAAFGQTPQAMRQQQS